MKNYLCLSAVLAAALSACDKNAPANPFPRSETVSVTFTGALNSTRTVYDPARGAAAWLNGDRLWVGAFSKGRLQYSWYPFEMVSLADNVATFRGNIQKAPSESSHVLYGVYPGNEFTIAVPTVSTRTQRPSSESFDGRCAVMYSKGIPVELGSGNSGENSDVPPMQFTHAMGFLKLRFDGLPAAYLKETVRKIEMNGANGDRLSGEFTFDVSDGAFVQDATAAYPSIILDYSDKNYALGELTAWFVVNPGTYGNVSFTVTTDNCAFIFAPRPALEIGAGEIRSRTIHFRQGDRAMRVETRQLAFTCTDLGITSTSTSGVNGSETLYDRSGSDGFAFKYNKAYKKSKTGDFLLLVKSSGYVQNTQPCGTRIVSVKVVSYNATIAKNFSMYFGTSASDMLTRQTTAQKEATFEPSGSSTYIDGVDYPYFKIQAAPTGIPQIASVEVVYQTFVEI